MIVPRIMLIKSINEVHEILSKLDNKTYHKEGLADIWGDIRNAKLMLKSLATDLTVIAEEQRRLQDAD